MPYATAPSISLPKETIPEWLHLLPAGPIQTRDGRGPYRIVDAKALIKASMTHGKLPLDVNHSTDLAAPHGRPAPARGWLSDLEMRKDGIWARVEWTDTGHQMLIDKEYIGVSPVIMHKADGEITAIMRASLTNTPNISGLSALHSAILPANGTTPAGIMSKARELQETFARHGLPIDLESAIASIMEQDAEEAAGVMEPEQIAMHARQVQATFGKLGLQIDFAGAVRTVLEKEGEFR